MKPKRQILTLNKEPKKTMNKYIYPHRDHKNKPVSCMGNLQDLLDRTCTQTKDLIQVGEHVVGKDSEQLQTVLRHHILTNGLPLSAVNFFDVCRIPKASS